MKKILITGGSGFIGTHIISQLLNDGQFEILSIDKQAPKIQGHQTIWKPIDICDKENLQKAIMQFSPDYVIHLAARTDLKGKDLSDYKANIDGVSNLLTILKDVPNLERVLFTSSMYVCYPGYQPKNFDDYAPHTIYGESKIRTEKLIKESNPSYTWAILRPTSIWGPYFGEPYDKFFRIVLSRIYFHLGKRACKKTYGYVGNTVLQILSILDADKSIINGNTYYLGDYAPYDITEWANEIATHEGFKIPTIPFFLFYIAGKVGDFLKLIGITFPMTSFRLKNMTTDNIHDLEPIRKIMPLLPFTRKEGNIATIKWIKDKK